MPARKPGGKSSILSRKVTGAVLCASWEEEPLHPHWCAETLLRVDVLRQLAPVGHKHVLRPGLEEHGMEVCHVESENSCDQSTGNDKHYYCVEGLYDCVTKTVETNTDCAVI